MPYDEYGQGVYEPAYFDTALTHHTLGAVEVPEGLVWPDLGYSNFGINVIQKTVHLFEDLPSGEFLAAQALSAIDLTTAQRDAWVYCLSSTIEVLRGSDTAETAHGSHRIYGKFRAGYLWNMDELPATDWHPDPGTMYTCVYVGDGTQELSLIPLTEAAELDRLALQYNPNSHEWMDSFMPGEVGAIGPGQLHRMNTAYDPEFGDKKLRAIFIASDYYEPDTSLTY